jgi:hypothetical protein
MGVQIVGGRAGTASQGNKFMGDRVPRCSGWPAATALRVARPSSPQKFGVIPSRFLFFINFGIFNGRKIKINNSRFLKIREKILQLDWIFPNLCAKFQIQINFFEGFRGGWQLGPSSVSTRTRPVAAGASSRDIPASPRAGQARAVGASSRANLAAALV